MPKSGPNYFTYLILVQYKNNIFIITIIIEFHNSILEYYSLCFKYLRASPHTQFFLFSAYFVS
jgi:hypothetical protein